MGRAKKRYYKLYMQLRKENPDERDYGRLYNRAIDIDQRQQAKLQAERWRKQCPSLDRLPTRKEN